MAARVQPTVAPGVWSGHTRRPLALLPRAPRGLRTGAPGAPPRAWWMAVEYGTASGDPGPTGIQVLVIEDDPAVSDVVQAVLEHAGYTVTVAADGAGGRAAIARGAPDLVIL